MAARDEDFEDDDEEDEDEVVVSGGEPVQLGYLEAPSPGRPLVSRYFPSKLGGRPVRVPVRAGVCMDICACVWTCRPQLGL